MHDLPERSVCVDPLFFSLATTRRLQLPPSLKDLIMFATRQWTRSLVNTLNKRRFTTQFLTQQTKIFSTQQKIALSVVGISLSGVCFMTITESASYNIEDVKKDLAKAISDDADRRGDGKGMELLFVYLLIISYLLPF